MFEKIASPYKQTFGGAFKKRGFKKDRISMRKWIIEIRDDENFIPPGDESETIPQQSLLTPVHEPTLPPHLHQDQLSTSNPVHSQLPVQQSQSPLPAQAEVHNLIKNAEHYQRTINLMQPAQHSSRFFTSHRNHWESDDNIPYRPLPQPPVQSTQSQNLMVYSWDDYADLPPREIPTSLVNANVQAQFMKIWKQTDDFIGDTYDLLDDKTRHFLTVCDSISVTSNQFAPLFRLILTGRAQQFFLTNIGRKESFRGIWTSSTFTDIRRKMKDSSSSEVFEAFIEKKQLTQRAFGVGYQNDGQLRTQIFTNCRGVPELDQALFDPGSTSQELFAKLRSAATIYGDRTPAGYM
ncbi:hypothetical protein Golomagni_02814 [Golovinomyces magnicellulatus]|nr:hypothetical protein Golomagni_02814 [Golovinomyces magnicellulatus]